MAELTQKPLFMPVLAKVHCMIVARITHGFRSENRHSN